MANDPHTDNFDPTVGKEFTVYLDHDGPLVAVTHHHPREQRIHYNGTGYYHVREHGGAWVYKQS